MRPVTPVRAMPKPTACSSESTASRSSCRTKSDPARPNPARADPTGLIARRSALPARPGRPRRQPVQQFRVGGASGAHLRRRASSARALANPLRRKLRARIVQEQFVLRIEHGGGAEIARLPQTWNQEFVEILLIG